LGNLSTPKSVQKLQTALCAKAKVEADYRFYALYDKISREDVLTHAYAQCRSNKGAPGVDGQGFADIEAYVVQRWLGELALCAQAGDLPSTLRDRMTAAMGEPGGMPLRLSRASVVRVLLPRSSISSTGHSSHILIRCSTRRGCERDLCRRFPSSRWPAKRRAGSVPAAIVTAF
jgi:hypothetical protein